MAYITEANFKFSSGVSCSVPCNYALQQVNITVHSTKVTERKDLAYASLAVKDQGNDSAKAERSFGVFPDLYGQ